MRDEGTLKGAPRARRGVVGVFLLVGVVVGAAALLLVASFGTPADASTSAGATLAKGAAARATERPAVRVSGGPLFPTSGADAGGPLSSTRCVADPAHAPKMTSAEIATVLKYVAGAFPGATWRDGEALYLEWGGGGSTSAFGTRTKLTHTVEHARGWCDEISGYEEMKCMARRGAWELFCHDPGTRLKKWGYPDDGSAPSGSPSRRRSSKSPESLSREKRARDFAFAENMRAYVQAPGRDQFANRTRTYDVVLIDGRARAACAHAVVPYLSADSVVLWHDFDRDKWRDLPKRNAAVVLDRVSRDPAFDGDRLYSKAAARLFDGVEHVDDLAVFKLKRALYQQTRWLE